MLKPYVMITLGLSIFTLGWKLFLTPHDITGGGVVGIDSILSQLLNIEQGYLMFVINGFLLFLGFRTLGLGYGFKTIYGTILISLLFIYIPEYKVDIERFGACLLGGAFSGVGLGLVFSVGGSAGGTDIIAMIVNKYYRSVSLGRVVLMCDVVIIGSSYIIYQSVESVVYGFCVMLVLSYTLDTVLNGFRQSVQFFIFSRKYEMLGDRISGELDRGITLLEGEGWYSKEPVKIIMVVVKKNQASKIFKLVREVDSEAFISQASVSGVYGKGFLRLDA